MFQEQSTVQDALGVPSFLSWHERNLRMSANLQRAIQPGDRILVLVGVAHVKILGELLRDFPGVELVDPLSLL